MCEHDNNLNMSFMGHTIRYISELHLITFFQTYRYSCDRVDITFVKCDVMVYFHISYIFLFNIGPSLFRVASFSLFVLHDNSIIS